MTQVRADKKIDLTDDKAQIQYRKSPSIPSARSRVLAPNAALFLLKSACLGNLNAFRAPGCRSPEQTLREKSKTNWIDLNNPGEFGLKGADLARCVFSGRSRLSMAKGNSVACVADALNLYKWRGPAATQAMGHVFFPRAPLSLDLPQVDVVLIPSEKKSERSEIRGRKI